MHYNEIEAGRLGLLAWVYGKPLLVGPSDLMEARWWFRAAR